MQPFNTNLFLKLTRSRDQSGYFRVRPAVKCEDGFEVSIQASYGHYCTPRVNDAPRYESVELGYPSMVDDLILEYAETPSEPTHTVYGQVPVEIVDQLIEKHGGMVDIREH